MLWGIDVSSHQKGIAVDSLPVDFVISKATEGTGYVNPDCDRVVQSCISNGIPFGYYHYARDNGAHAEADYFYENTLGYHGKGIPVLDWEEDQSVEWVNAFVQRFHQKTGVWCWIYANPWRFNQGGVEQNCGRWIAQYPNVVSPGLGYELPDVPETDGLVCCWQYASDGYVKGYSGNLDVNCFFGDVDAWNAYCGKHVENVENPEKSVLENNDFIVEITQKN